MEYEMGGACGPWDGKRMHTELRGENMKKKRIIGKHRNRWIILEWIYLSTRTSSVTQWNRLLLTCSNNFIILVVKKNKTVYIQNTSL
jgi:hypothetical protein